jgi:hypothetical protein
MTTFILLADNDPAIDLRTFIKSFDKNGKRIAAATPVPVPAGVVVKDEKVDDGFEEVVSSKGKKGKKEAKKEVGHSRCMLFFGPLLMSHIVGVYNMVCV